MPVHRNHFFQQVQKKKKKKEWYSGFSKYSHLFQTFEAVLSGTLFPEMALA